MNQFFFGSVDKPLYGVHHAPAAARQRDSAVLVCDPTGREYMRCHRALVKLCDRLAQAGFHSMRFDYFATGDSAGDEGDGNIEEWLENAKSAAEELTEIAGVSRISVIGVRLGAAVAARLAADDDLVDALILWDPVVDGERYLQEITTMHHAFVSDSGRFPEAGRHARNISGSELVGMVYSDALRQSIARVKPALLPPIKARHMAYLVTEDQKEYRDSYQVLSQTMANSDFHVVDEPAAWNSLSDLGVVMMPHELIKQVVSIIGESEN